MIIRLVIDLWELVKVAQKGRGHGKGWMGGGIRMGAAGFCSPCAYLGIFLLLKWRVLVSRIAGGWICVQ
jgi:hypothetical protein